MINKAALITGGTGFLGTYIKNKLLNTHYSVYSIGRNEHISTDLAENVPIIPNEWYDKVIHIAGKAHVFPKTESEAEDFFKVNLQGTLNLLRGLENLTTYPSMFVFISTVAVYGLIEGENIREDYPTNANTPYGISKLEAEKAIIKWCQKRNINYLILRLPLIAGKNPPGNLGDMKKSIQKGFYIGSNKNSARKSVVLAEDIATLLSRKINASGIFHLTDGIHPSFLQIEQALEIRLSQNIIFRLPFFFINFLAKIGDLLTYILKKDMPISSLRLKKLTSTLTFDDTKARKELNWEPNPVLPFIEKQI